MFRSSLLLTLSLSVGKQGGEACMDCSLKAKVVSFQDETDW